MNAVLVDLMAKLKVALARSILVYYLKAKFKKLYFLHLG